MPISLIYPYIKPTVSYTNDTCVLIDMHVTTSHVKIQIELYSMFRVTTLHRVCNHIGCTALGSTVADRAIYMYRS